MSLEDAEDRLVEPRRMPELDRRAHARGQVREGVVEPGVVALHGRGQLEEKRPGAVAEQPHPPLDDLRPALGCVEPFGVGQGARRLDRHLEPGGQPVVPPGERGVPRPAVVARVELDRPEPLGVELQPAPPGHPLRVERPGPAVVGPPRRAHEDRHPGILPPREASAAAQGVTVSDGRRHVERTQTLVSAPEDAPAAGPGRPGLAVPAPYPGDRSGSTLSAGRGIWGSIPGRPLMWSGSDCATVGG